MMALDDYISAAGSYYTRKLRNTLLESMFQEGETRWMGLSDAPYSMRRLKGKDHPLGVSDGLLKTARMVASPYDDELSRAKAIYDWMVNVVRYDHASAEYDQGRASFDPAKHRMGYRNASKTYEDKKGVCGEMAYLYIAMARTARLECQYLDVETRHDRSQVKHACVILTIDGRAIQVDPTMAVGGFDVKHRKHAIKSDAQMASDYFRWNRKEDPAWLQQEVHQARHGELGDYHPGVSCERWEQDMRRPVSLPSSAQGSWLSALLLVAAVGICGYGACRGGAAAWEWWMGGTPMEVEAGSDGIKVTEQRSESPKAVRQVPKKRRSRQHR